MEVFESILNSIDNVVWGPALIVLILATGILLTWRTKGIQFKKLGRALKSIMMKSSGEEGEVSSFGALCTALSATIGTGNIVGVATAVASGGPGALFWMWVAAFLGIATKYAECMLAVNYREVSADGHVLGGPFLTIERGMGKKWKWLAVCFAVFAAMAGLLGIGTMTQINGITNAVQGVFDPGKANVAVTIFGNNVTWSVVIAGAIVTLCAALVIIGGIKRISRVATFIVPFMAALYLVIGIFVILFNLSSVTAAFQEIFRDAFGARAISGGIVGTLIAVSKIFDGFTDVFIGSMIDKTKSRMGKARPWMLYGYVGCAITLIACFAIPTSLGKTAQYAWFFIAYTLLNGVFYTANNIAYSALTSLITKNSKERVQMGSYRFIFAFSTSLLIQAITVGFVDFCGGDAAAWRLVAIIYAVIGLISNTISTLSVKELPEEELNEGKSTGEEEKYGLVQAFKLLVKNKFYLMICGTYILQQLYSAMIGAGIYYMTWVLKNKNLFGQFAWAVNIPLIIALIFTPTLVGKWKGMYKLNKRGYLLAVIGRALVVVAGYMGSIPLMMAFTAVAALGQGPWQGDMNAVIASCSEYTYLTQGKRVDGTMYSCTSLGIKLGGGIGTAVVGWMLELSGYVGTNAVQPQSALNMMQFMYLWLPLIFDVLIWFILSKMNVEEANEKIKKEKGITTQTAQ